MTDKNPILSEHFEHLRSLIPEVYGQSAIPTDEMQLMDLLKKSLGIIEAIYLQGVEAFPAARAEKYAEIISGLQKLGMNYSGNRELLERATQQVLMDTKLPMKRAQGRSNALPDEERKAM